MINNNFYIFKKSFNEEYEVFSVLSLMFFEFSILIDLKFLDNLRKIEYNAVYNYLES
jgi:hypothetical protein